MGIIVGLLRLFFIYAVVVLLLRVLSFAWRNLQGLSGGPAQRRGPQPPPAGRSGGPQPPPAGARGGPRAGARGGDQEVEEADYEELP
jgi:hypothetical protein